MNKLSNAIKWVIHNFFFLSIVILVVFYLRWFRLTPFVLMDDPTFAFIGGFVLLIIYGGLATFFIRIRDRALKVLLAVVNIFVMCINVLYLFVHMPHIETTAVCNGTRYYISYGALLGDEQWIYTQMSKWKGVFYESRSWGYAADAGANEIRCDIDNKETLFLRTYAEPPTLTYIDGEHPQSFYKYSGAKLRGYLYFLSEDWYRPENCNREEYWACDVSVYRLYQCKSDYTNCHQLPITYNSSNDNYLELKANKNTNEVKLFQEKIGGDDKTLIFTYGENSRCYADGCTINNQ